MKSRGEFPLGSFIYLTGTTMVKMSIITWSSIVYQSGVGISMAHTGETTAQEAHRRGQNQFCG
jgi:hypothetical protein